MGEGTAMDDDWEQKRKNHTRTPTDKKTACPGQSWESTGHRAATKRSKLHARGKLWERESKILGGG